MTVSVSACVKKTVNRLLPVLFFLTVYLFVFSVSAEADVEVGGIVYEGEIDQAAAFDVLDLVNAVRVKEGLSPLKMDRTLLQAAQKRAGEITAQFAHTRPDGSPFHTITNGEKVMAMAENIASGGGWIYMDAGTVMNGWLNSPGHYANIMEPSAVSIGIACIRRQDPMYGSRADWVQLFSPVEGEEIRGMYRLYNPNSGEHFYTAVTGEKDILVLRGWKAEGLGWLAPADSREPVYRLYNPNAGDHHYTMNAAERKTLIRFGWKDEGVGWYSDPQQGIPLYRQYNPNAIAGAHNYTTSRGENDWLMTLGWQAEGIGWYARR